MNEKLIQKLATIKKVAEGGMPPGMMPPGDPMMGGAPPMDPGMMGPPVPTSQEIMGMGGMPPMDPAMGGMPPMDPAMMGGMPPPMDPAMMGGMPPPMDPMAGMPIPDPGPSPEELAVEQANAEALSSMGAAVQSLTEVLAKEQASVSDTIQNAANVAAASPIAEELTPADIGPLIEADAV